jgi:hypothetical protein
MWKFRIRGRLVLKKFPQGIKLFLVLIISTGYVFSFSHFGVQAYNFYKPKPFSVGTSISGIELKGKTNEEAIQLVNHKISDWKKSANITIQLNENKSQLNLDSIQFKTEESIQKLKDGQALPISLLVSQDELTKKISSLSAALNLKNYNLNKLIASISEIASRLKSGNYVLNLQDYGTDSEKTALIVKTIINIDNPPADLQIAISKLTNINIDGQSSFSFLKCAEVHGLKSTSSDSLSIIASGIYQTIQKTNFEIMEKNTSPEVPYYLSPGFEARVDSEKNNDFVFVNPNQNSYQLELKGSSTGITITLYGEKLLNSYKIDPEIQYFAPKTILQFSPLLIEGQVKIERKGIKGILVKVYREEFQNDQLLHRELISEDFYPPIPKIEVHPLAENQTNSNSDSSSNQEGNQTNSNSVPGAQTESQSTSNSNLDNKAENASPSGLTNSTGNGVNGQ